VPTALVTGASGFVGWHVARTLIERGFKVRALCRPTSKLRELDAERVQGDLRDPQSLDRAVAGCSVVFHVAADYRLWTRNPEELYESNVNGTKNLLEAAFKAGADRVVYTSTVGCIGMPQDHDGDEDSAVSIDDMTGHYKRSKWLAERVALEKASAGFPVVIVNPTAPVGDHDWKPTPTGKILVDFLRDRLPAFVDTGLNLVDVRDVAAGHVLAAEHGAPGERYILGGENVSFQEILNRLGAIAHKPAPRTRIPYPIALAVGVVSTTWANLTGREPVAPLEGVRMARKKMFVSPAKAIRELSFHPQPVDGALRRALAWFQANNYC
jgi:dihydroflavonol-4-reductase